MSTLRELMEAITAGENRQAVALAAELLGMGVSEHQVITEGLTKALEALDAKCTASEFDLVEILLAGRAMTDVLDKVLRPRLEAGEREIGDTRTVIVLGTIQGDIHDLGKNIVATVLRAAGLKVVELGRDISAEEFVLAARKEGASFIGVSSLLTFTIPEIRKVKDLLLEHGLSRIEVIAGGAAIARTTPEYLNVDFVAKDALVAWRYIKGKVVGGNRHVGQ